MSAPNICLISENERLRALVAELADKGTLNALRDANDRAERAEAELDEAREILKDCWNWCIQCEIKADWMPDVDAFLKRTEPGASQQVADAEHNHTEEK